MSDNTKFNLSHAQFGGGFAAQGDVHGGQIINPNQASDKNLADAAKEIQQLLEELDKTYPTNTVSGRMGAVQEAIQKIEENPTLHERFMGAIRGGTSEAFKQTIDHPLISIIVEAFQGGINPN